MRYSLLTQLALIGVSLIIVFSFIKPMFADIGLVGDQIAEYNQAIEDANAFNDKLQKLLAIQESLSDENKNSLENFLPSEIDAVKIMHDIESIFLTLKIPITTLATTDEKKTGGGRRTEDEESASEMVGVGSQDFDIAFSGSYEQLKEVLALVEQSESLLEVAGLKFTSVAEDETVTKKTKNDEYVFSLALRAYGLASSSQ